MIRVLIAAQSAIAREGLETLLKSDGEIRIAGSVDFSGLPDSIEETRGDVILADANVGENEPALEFDEIARSRAALVILSDDGPPSRTLDALRSGAAAVLPRDSPPARILGAINAAAAGLIVLEPRDLRAVLARPPIPAALPEPLTPREIEVLKMLAEGLSNKLIAVDLGISEHTVKFNVNSILGKRLAPHQPDRDGLGEEPRKLPARLRP